MGAERGSRPGWVVPHTPPTQSVQTTRADTHAGGAKLPCSCTCLPTLLLDLCASQILHLHYYSRNWRPYAAKSMVYSMHPGSAQNEQCTRPVSHIRLVQVFKYTDKLT